MGEYPLHQTHTLSPGVQKICSALNEITLHEVPVISGDCQGAVLSPSGTRILPHWVNNEWGMKESPQDS